MMDRQIIFSILLVLIFACDKVESFFFQKAKVSKPTPLLQDLEALIVESKNGLEKSYDGQIQTIMTEISSSRKGDQREALPGKWELVYTTEKEINFFKTSWPFAKVSSITQDLDLYGNRVIDNFIDFEGGGQFAVTGTVEAVKGNSGYDRVSFVFQGALVRGWGKELLLPPTGAGWFDTMYCDDEYRLSRDSRNDWSIFKRI